FIGFTAVVPSGPSELLVRYRARAAGVDQGDPRATWLFHYVLAPARAWGSFGALEVTAFLPEGWEHDGEPTLEREGDVLFGSFSGVPADSLTVAVRAPLGPAYHWAVAGSVGLYAVALIGGVLLCWFGGAWSEAFLKRKMSPGLRQGLLAASF